MIASRYKLIYIKLALKVYFRSYRAGIFVCSSWESGAHHNIFYFRSVVVGVLAFFVVQHWKFCFQQRARPLPSFPCSTPACHYCICSSVQFICKRVPIYYLIAVACDLTVFKHSLRHAFPRPSSI